MHNYIISNRIFFLGLFFLLIMIIPVPQCLADDGSKALSHDEMVILASRGTYAFSSGNIDEPEMIFAPNFVRHEQQYLTPEAKLENISKLIEHQREYYKVEDIQTEPIDTIVDVQTQRVAVRWSADVTRLPSAEDSDIPQHMKFEGVTISRFENGKIAEQWVYYDSELVLTLTRLRYKDYFESAPTTAK